MFISSIPSYIGFAIGVLVGNVTEHAKTWVFAAAASLFLYVALVDVLPELFEKIEEIKSHKKTHSAKTPLINSALIVANIGLLFGIITAFLVSAFGDAIEKYYAQ